MEWIAPEVHRMDEPTASDERMVLEGLLEWQRMTLLQKCAGLTGQQLTLRAVPPSTLSLLGLIRHTTDAERAWFRRHLCGENVADFYASPNLPNAAFDDVLASDAEQDFGRLIKEMQLAREAATTRSLDDLFVHPVFGVMSLRWLYGHMIAEYARHIGHADLLRECIDGKTGE